jgi:hypothetical protein
MSARRLRYLMSHIVSRFDPGCNRVLNVRNGFLRGLAIGHATRQVRDGREESPSLLEGQGLNDDVIFQPVHEFDLTASIKATSCLIYTGLTGLLEGMVSLPAIRG